MREVGVDGVMVARGAVRDPWLWRHLSDSATDSTTTSAHAAPCTVDTSTSIANPISVRLSRPTARRLLRNHLPSLQEVKVAEASYLDRAAEWGAKDHVRSFHQANFQRLIKLAQQVRRQPSRPHILICHQDHLHLPPRTLVS